MARTAIHRLHHGDTPTRVAGGFYDLVEEHLRPAKEIETIDPREMVAEDP